MDGISRSRGWDKEIPHGVLPMEQPVLSDKWARKHPLSSVGKLSSCDWVFCKNDLHLQNTFAPLDKSSQ